MSTERSKWKKLVDQLRNAKYQFGVFTQDTPIYEVGFDKGLTDAEVTHIENRYGFRFPPDLRDFLQTALPRGPLFPDWRSGNDGELRDWLDIPRRGVLFDVEHNKFWLDDWESRPSSLEEALRVAGKHLTAAPQLIPVFSHRMMPDEPHLPGNPVFSVHQTDIIRHGVDLTDYLCHEFGLQNPDSGPEPKPVRQIRFWDPDRFQSV